MEGYTPTQMIREANVSRNIEINVSYPSITLKPQKNPAFLKLDEDKLRPRNSHILSEETEGRTSMLSGNYDQTYTAYNSSQKIEIEGDVMSQQTIDAGRYEVEGLMDSPLKLMQTTRGDMRQIEVVSELYASELTEIVNIETLKLDFLNLDMEDILNTTNKKVYSKAQILSFVDSA